MRDVATFTDTSPGAQAIRDALIPDPGKVATVALTLSASQGRALAMLHDGSCSVSNRWGYQTVPASTARTLLDLDLAETTQRWPSRSGVRLTRFGRAVVDHVTGADRG